jgi:MAE_28990/MAE_18760-like HEPN
MSKPYSEADFSEQITQDRAWRLREISDLKAAIVKADASLRRVLLRALVTVCYAHWEGYVRFAARKYLEHVALRRFLYSDLDRQFLRNYFLPRLVALSASRTSVAERCALIDDILNGSAQRFSRVNDDLINTRTNLTFDVFTDICLVCCVPTQLFADSATFVDVVLLRRRNLIAHGEDTFITIDDLDELTNETITLMRTFGDALENHVYVRDYRAA